MDEFLIKKRDAKSIGKDTSELYTNKMDVEDQRLLNMGFVVYMWISIIRKNIIIGRNKVP